MSDHPLPDGWIKQYDANHGHSFWQVDTRADPPRSIWVHPYEDEHFLAMHPEARATEPDAPPSYDVATAGDIPSTSAPSDVILGDSEGSSRSDHKRGVFGRLKDKVIGTKKEREEHKRIKTEQAAREEEREREARLRYQKEREERKRIKAEQAARQARIREAKEQEERRVRAEHAARAEERARQARMRELEEREAYMRAYGGYAPYRPSYTDPPQRGFGTDNTAAYLIGGLVGGLLLGDIFGGGF